MKSWTYAFKREESAPTLVIGAVCPQCRVLHSPVDTHGDFLDYCTAHRPLKLAEKHRYEQVMGWVDRNFDKVAALYDAETAEQRAKEAQRDQAAYAQMQNAFRPNPYDTNAQASGLGTWTEVFGGPNA